MIIFILAQEQFPYSLYKYIAHDQSLQPACLWLGSFVHDGLWYSKNAGCLARSFVSHSESDQRADETDLLK